MRNYAHFPIRGAVHPDAIPWYGASVRSDFVQPDTIPSYHLGVDLPEGDDANYPVKEEGPIEKPLDEKHLDPESRNRHLRVERIVHGLGGLPRG